MMNFKPLLWPPIVFLLSACTPVGIVNLVSKFYSTDVHKNIAYGDHQRQKFDLYIPHDHQRKEPMPVILFFYGGSWNSGNKADYQFVGRRLAAEGYIVAVADYRLSPEVAYPDFLDDSAAAFRGLYDLLRSDKYKGLNTDEKFFVMGHSAGAYNAAMLAMDSRWLAHEGLDNSNVVRGAIGLAGAYDLYPIIMEDVKPVFHHPNYPEQSDPISFTHEVQVPLLLLAPESDDIISTEKHSYGLANKLKKEGKEVQLEMISGTNHVTVLGTLSPLLFFKGSSLGPINSFITRLSEAKAS